MARGITPSARQLARSFGSLYWPVVLMIPLVLGALLGGLRGATLYIALAVIAIIAVVASEIGPLSFDRVFRQSRSRSTGGAHIVEVHDVRPLPNERRPWDPYFVALCTCDCPPRPRDTEAAARADAHEHASKTGGCVQPELRRPVG
jgi:hypothetical protein